MDGLISYLKVKYGPKVDEWKGQTGDKGKYCDLYHSMIEALESLGPVTNLYIKVAIFKAIAQDETFLLSVLQRYN